MAIVLKDIDDAAGVVAETREYLPSHFLVKIESFSLFSKFGMDKYESSEFETGGCKWRLIIYPDRRKSGTTERYISVYLSLADPIPLDMSLGVNAVFGIFLRDQISDKFFCKQVSMNPGQACCFDALTPAWGFSKFISKTMFVVPSSGYLVQDSCIFGAEVFAFKRPAVERLSLRHVGEPYKRSWTISEFSKLVDKEWRSDEFRVGDRNWYVTVHWDGQIDGHGGSEIETFLHFSEDNLPGQRVKVNFTFRVRDQIKCNYKTYIYDHWYKEPDSCWGDFVEIADMKNGGVVVKDCCTFEIVMSVEAVAERSP